MIIFRNASDACIQIFVTEASFFCHIGSLFFAEDAFNTSIFDSSSLIL